MRFLTLLCSVAGVVIIGGCTDSPTSPNRLPLGGPMMDADVLSCTRSEDYVAVATHPSLPGQSFSGMLSLVLGKINFWGDTPVWGTAIYNGTSNVSGTFATSGIYTLNFGLTTLAGNPIVATAVFVRGASSYGTLIAYYPVGNFTLYWNLTLTRTALRVTGCSDAPGRRG